MDRTGRRRYSTCWLYPFLIFGAGCLLPWRPSKGGTLPLGAAYVNPHLFEPQVFMDHLAATVALTSAAVAAHILVHDRIKRRKPALEWWQHYSKGVGLRPRSPGPDERPELSPGDAVRLRGKPDRRRRVQAAEWHRFRHEYVYVVETTAPAWFRPYWFRGQLVRETDEDQPVAGG